MSEGEIKINEIDVEASPLVNSLKSYENEILTKTLIDEIYESYFDHHKDDRSKIYTDIDGLLKHLQVDKKKGLDGKDIQDLINRRIKFSVIQQIPSKESSLFDLIKNSLKSVILRLLILVAFISIFLGVLQKGWKKGCLEGLVLLTTAVVVIFIQSYTDYNNQKQFSILNKIKQTIKHETKRNGHIQLINVNELVVGDIVQITPGCIPKADGLLVACDLSLQVDESALSGESEIKVKDVGSCIFEGCPVIDGYGEMVVLRLGKESNLGRIHHSLSSTEQEISPLQQKLTSVANQIGIFAVISGQLSFFILMGMLIYSNYQNDKCFECVNFFTDTMRHLMFGFIVFIIAIPEGLPLSVTIALAYSVNQMYLENNLVKQLNSCETMAEVSEICTDKTGTLTYGEMQLKKVLINFNSLPLEHLTNNTSLTKDLLIQIILSTSKTVVDQTEDDGQSGMNDNVTELALFKWVESQNIPDTYKNIEKIRSFPFSSKNRCSATIVSFEGSLYLYLKGQPEQILSNCSQAMFNDEIIQFTLSDKQKVQKQIDHYSKQAFRGLLFAIKKLEVRDYKRETFSDEDIYNLINTPDLTFISACFFQDDLRAEVKQAVQILKGAGVTTRMITGDSYGTAKAIAIQAGIISENEDNAIVTGYEIAQMEDAELADRVESIKVVAKCSPELKLKFVRALKSKDKLVAVTGDGTNDVPCFKVSDVSFAMGKNGTEIVKETADIILLDDNFASIVTACSWGRNIQEGIKKFLVFQLAINIVAIFVTMIGAVSFGEAPLSSSQILWINLIQDTLASLALATDKPSPDLLNRQPYNRNESIINGYMRRCIVFQSCYQLIVLISILAFFGGEQFQHHRSGDGETFDTTHTTIFFQTFVLLILFNEFNCINLRRDTLNPFKDILRNKIFFAIIFSTFIVQLALVQFSGEAFKCTPISLGWHIFCFVIGFGGIIINYIQNSISEPFYDGISIFKDEIQVKIWEKEQESKKRMADLDNDGINDIGTHRTMIRKYSSSLIFQDSNAILETASNEVLTLNSQNML